MAPSNTVRTFKRVSSWKFQRDHLCNTWMMGFGFESLVYNNIWVYFIFQWLACCPGGMKVSSNPEGINCAVEVKVIFVVVEVVSSSWQEQSEVKEHHFSNFTFDTAQQSPPSKSHLKLLFLIWQVPSPMNSGLSQFLDPVAFGSSERQRITI